MALQSARLFQPFLIRPLTAITIRYPWNKVADTSTIIHFFSPRLEPDGNYTSYRHSVFRLLSPTCTHSQDDDDVQPGSTALLSAYSLSLHT